MTILMVAFVNVCFVSCGDDGDTPKPSSEVSIIGRWKYSFGSNDYCLLTFDNEGTVLYQEYDGGMWEDEEIYAYTYKNGTLIFFNINDDAEIEDVEETIKVISLTSTQLVLKDWPDGGTNIFIRQ